METFGATLRRLRCARGLSLRALSAQVAYDYGYLGQIERADRPPTAAVAAACDRVLAADGLLVRRYEEHSEEDGMRRRTVLRALTGMAVASGSLEALRQGLGYALDADHDGWTAVAVEYGHAYYTTPPAELIAQLTDYVVVLQQMIAVETGARSRELARTASVLAVLLALSLHATGRTRVAARWWSSARLAAARSGSADARLLVGSWEVVNGLYSNRPLGQLIVTADETLAAAGGRVTAAVAGVLAGRAQALALLGSVVEAEATVRQVADVTERMPDDIVADGSSVFGWPEHRLRHTESFVYTHTGNLRAAQLAQERALALYRTDQLRLRTQVELHRAACAIKSGDITGGLRQTAELLDALPGQHHTANLRHVAGQVLGSLAPHDRNRPEVNDLRHRLAAGPVRGYP